ncbi:hypothetical protein FMM56_05815 [Campylobacter sp. LR264d]|uniref:hypothetical protein n=1 Tax=Campylobacter sp. LR264d TaxID=2593544 RepID=UPI00123B8583|nr:hypothetical protein [Campylobacter sp. LR264d]KAA6230851.1 hypothetical protein FMM56_05815 [Campylobacter sp. LR264d]
MKYSDDRRKLQQTHEDLINAKKRLKLSRVKQAQEAKFANEKDDLDGKLITTIILILIIVALFEIIS